jgi:large subunit ribosomal protein L22
MAVRAISRGVGISPKRLFPLLQAVRGKRVQEALEVLRFLSGPAAAQLGKVVRSAAANAENNLRLNPNRLRVVAASAGPGPVTKRFRARARGRAGRVLRRSSHITIVVDEEGV